jgi:hypothetical protein
MSDEQDAPVVNLESPAPSLAEGVPANSTPEEQSGPTDEERVEIEESMRTDLPQTETPVPSDGMVKCAKDGCDNTFGPVVEGQTLPKFCPDHNDLNLIPQVPTRQVLPGPNEPEYDDEGHELTVEGLIALARSHDMDADETGVRSYTSLRHVYDLIQEAIKAQGLGVTQWRCKCCGFNKSSDEAPAEPKITGVTDVCKACDTALGREAHMRAMLYTA